MATPAASPPANIGFTCTNEELFNALDKLTSGSPLPSDVIDYINPYGYQPQHIHEAGDFWFLISLKENVYMECGFWKIQEEAREVLSNSDIIGWRTTLEYYEGQVPHKTDWLMQVFSTTQKRLCDENKKKETSALCRIFLAPSHEMQQKVSSAATQTPVLDAQSSTRRGSSSNTGVNKHDETVVLDVAKTLPLPENQGDNFEMGFSSGGQIDFSSGDGYLELLDLDNPASSSSSENSSAPSISSDECFDTMAFLQELEEPVLEQSNADRKLNVSASNKLEEVVMVPATLEPLVSVERSNSSSDEFLKPTGAATISASGSSSDLNNKVAKHAKGDQKAKGPSSSSSRKPSTSSESHLVASGGRKRAGFGGMKKLRKKYLCFMPF